MNNTNVSNSQSAMNTYYFTIFLRTLIMAAGFTGNILVVVTLLRHRGMRTVTNILLLNLSISDLLIISVCMSFTMAVDLLQNFVFGTAGCVIIRFCQGVTIAANAFTLCAIALERFFAIVLPLRSRGFQTTKHAQKMIACIWILAALLMVPFGAFHDARALNANSSILRCEVYARDRIEWKLYFFLMLLVLIVLPAIFLSSAYGMILITLSRRLRFHGSERDGRSFKHKSPSRPTGSPLFPGSATPTLPRSREADCVSSNIAQSTYRTIAMLLCIVALFFICCVPNYAQQTWYMMNAVQARRVLRSYSGYILLLQNLNTCVNPVCYCFMSRSFRHHFLQVFGCGKRRRVPTSSSYLRTNPLVARQNQTGKRLVVHLMNNTAPNNLLDGSHAAVSVQNSHETDLD